MVKRCWHPPADPGAAARQVKVADPDSSRQQAAAAQKRAGIQCRQVTQQAGRQAGRRCNAGNGR